MKRPAGWGDTLIGVLVGVSLTVGAMVVLNSLQGWHRLSAWQRALDERQADQLEVLMLDQIFRAGRSLDDADPTQLSSRMAGTIFPALYRHYLAHARFLLEHGQVEEFNQLRTRSTFAILDLSDAKLAGLDLSTADFAGAVLERVDLRGARLDQATFFRARLAGADLSESHLDAADFGESDLSGARLNAIVGEAPDFRDAVLVNVSMTGVQGVSGAKLNGATMAQCNLFGSRFPGAVLDGADLTLASAIDTDFSAASSMDAVVATGANLTGARFHPATTTRLWFPNAQGISAQLERELRGHGGVRRAEDLLALVDARIVGGFRAQLENLPDTTPEAQRSLLLDLLRQFWMQ